MNTQQTGFTILLRAHSDTAQWYSKHDKDALYSWMVIEAGIMRQSDIAKTHNLGGDYPVVNYLQMVDVREVGAGEGNRSLVAGLLFGFE